ncbi:MAG: DNA cytosine methyltransferase, partial [bacterium]
MDNSKELKHISLCAGYGGIDLGLSRALGSIRTVCFVEIEAFAIQNLVAKIEKGFLDQAPIFTNLKTFHWELFHGKVDILSGGFPCQPFSAAGRRKGSEDPRHLWPYITDGIKRLGRPPIVYFENVEGIISSKLKGDDWSDPEGTPVLLHVLRELERLGYKATSSVFSASEIGAPHQRKRVFILGVRNDLTETGISLINGLIKSNQSDRNTAWPASRRQKQYWYEPPRVTMGDSKSWPCFCSERWGESEIKRVQVQTREPSELGDSNGRNKESHGFEHR